MSERIVRNTKQKDAIREALRDSSEFISAQQLHQQLEETGHHIGLATVYRQLNALANQGVVDTVRMFGQQLFRLCADERHHHHLVCISCGKTVEIDPPNEQWLRNIANSNGFTLEAHTLEVFGICANCQNTQADK